MMSDFGEDATTTIKEAMKSFPETFGLRAWPKDRFRISQRNSYVSNGVVFLYTQRFDGKNWSDWAKGTPEELKQVIVQL